MNSVTTALRLSAVLFGLVCIAHIWRFVAHVPVTFGNWIVPLWPSGVAAVVTGALSIWLFSLSRSS